MKIIEIDLNDQDNDSVCGLKVAELVAKDPKVLSNHDPIAFICNKNHRNWSKLPR